MASCIRSSCCRVRTFAAAGNARLHPDHEYVHIRRFDCLLKLLLTAALCLHWLNPLVWVMYLLANRDIELCCDEVVLPRMGLEKRSVYAMTLIDLEEQKSGLSLVQQL